MEVRKVSQVVYKIIATSFLSSLFIVGSVSAESISYQFDVKSLFGVVNQPGLNDSDAKTYFSSGLGEAMITYNQDTRNVNLVVRGYATIDKRVRNVDAQGYETYDIQETISNNSYYQGNLVISNVSPTTNPDGFAGLTREGSTASGVFEISNVGDVTGDSVEDAIRFDYASMSMDFTHMANDQNYLAELAGVGDANMFVWDSKEFLSLAAVYWFQNTGSILIADNIGNAVYDNGNIISSVKGDLVLHNGQTPIPEPTSIALFGCGMLGAFRRKSKKAA